MWLWFVIWGVIAFAIVVILNVIYKKEPPWFITGAWIVASINVFTAWANQGELEAANKATVMAVLLALLHFTHWIYTKAKGGAKKLTDALPKKTSIDDTIYDQIASEMSTGDINGGLMARAIAEADGDKDRTQAIYIKLRAAAIAKELEQAKHDDAEKRIEESRAELLKGMTRIETNNSEDLSSDYSLRSPARRSWENKLAHRVGLCFLWYAIAGLIGSILFTLFSVPDWSRFTTQEIGEFIAVSAMFLGLALLCYIGTLKLKW